MNLVTEYILLKLFLFIEEMALLNDNSWIFKTLWQNTAVHILTQPLRLRINHVPDH
jgi:hypothetical protein